MQFFVVMPEDGWEFYEKTNNGHDKAGDDQYYFCVLG